MSTNNGVHSVCLSDVTQSGKFRSYVGVAPIHLLRISPDLYMLLVGGTELVCVGLILFARSGLFSRSHPELLATWVLFLIAAGGVYTHICVGDRLADMAWVLAGLGFVLIRLYTMGALDDVRIKLKV